MNKQKALLKRVFSIAMTMVLVATLCAFPTSAKTKEELQAEIDRLEQQIEANNGKIEDKKESIEELEKQIAPMQKQLSLFNKQISELDKQIAEKDNLIQEYQTEIDRLQGEIDAANAKISEQEEMIAGTKDLLAERMRSAYMAGESSTLEILFTADDFEDFLTRLELLHQVAKRDNAMMADLQEKIDALGVLKEELSTSQTEQESKQNTVEAERAEIASTRAEQQKLASVVEKKQSNLERQVQSMNKMISSLDKQSDAFKRQQAAAQKAKDEYDNIHSGNMEHGSGGKIDMTKPLLDPSIGVSQHYGHNGHKGVDLSNGHTHGVPIYATADGVVATAEYHYSWGNNVYINHGDGIYTRYAHCSSMVVRAGQSVKQGQLIGYVGNTGNSFGAHLHFEVWVNGTRVNPEPWIPHYPNR